MTRRRWLQAVAAALAFPGALFAQRRYRLGLLATSDDESVGPFFLDPFLAGMRELGYLRDRDFTLDIRYAPGKMTTLAPLADELIALKPDVLLGIQPAAIALAEKTRTIPIILIGSSDPVAAGLARSLSRPGTNVTGVAHLYEDLVAKQIELLSEIVQKMTRVGLLYDSPSPTRDRLERAARSAAAARKLTFVAAAGEDAAGVRRAMEELKAAGAQGVVVGPSGTLVFLRDAVLQHATRLRLPAIYAQSELPRQGGLVSYGADLPASYRQDVPRYVERILKGANPAETAIQQTTKYELVVNVKTARAIGLTLPRPVLLRADRVIE